MHVRAALTCGAMNLCAESGIDIGTDPRFGDAGDLELGVGERAATEIERAIGAQLAHGARVLSLGGDHAVTYPIVRAFAAHHDGLTLLHYDAHPDLYHGYAGNRLSHASPFARICEERLVRRLVQVGIRTLEPHQREQAARFGVEVHELRHGLPDVRALALAGPVYVSVDIDVLDPAFAPGVSHPEPGGVGVRELLRSLQAIDAPVVGADLVELNPRRDVNDTAAFAAAKLVKELAALILSS
jgi:agmatinase